MKEFPRPNPDFDFDFDFDLNPGDRNLMP